MVREGEDEESDWGDRRERESRLRFPEREKGLRFGGWLWERMGTGQIRNFLEFLVGMVIYYWEEGNVFFVFF